MEIIARAARSQVAVSEVYYNQTRTIVFINLVK